jgi:hypothetical protein
MLLSVLLFGSIDDQSESQSFVVDPLLVFDCCMKIVVAMEHEDGENKMPRMKRRV